MTDKGRRVGRGTRRAHWSRAHTPKRANPVKEGNHNEILTIHCVRAEDELQQTDESALIILSYSCAKRFQTAGHLLPPLPRQKITSFDPTAPKVKPPSSRRKKGQGARGLGSNITGSVPFFRRSGELGSNMTGPVLFFRRSGELRSESQSEGRRSQLLKPLLPCPRWSGLLRSSSSSDPAMPQLLRPQLA